MTWVKRPGSEPASQIASRRDEEIGTQTEIQTGTEEIYEVDRNGGPSTDTKVQQDLHNLDHACGPDYF